MENQLKRTDIATYLPGKDGEIQKAFESPKIRDCVDGDIKQLFIYILALTGIKAENFGQGKELALMDFVKSKYQHYTLDEFKVAFKMALAGDFGNRIEHYQSLDATFFGSVMNAYNLHRNKVRKKLADAAVFSSGVYNSQAPGYRPEDYFDSLNRIIHNLGALPFAYSWSRVYPHLVKLKGEPSPETKLAIAEIVKNKEPESVTSNPEKMAHECKAEFVKLWFMKKHNCGIQEEPKFKTVK